MPRHLPVLDGLRGVAVLLVMWCHVPAHTPGYPSWLNAALMLVGPGSLGVEIFFVLSGFLITRILLAERAAGTPLRWFLLRRAFRIFPAYYVLLLLLLPTRPLDEIAWCAIYLHNLDAILRPHATPLGHTWSLCVEEHFYLMWPPLVAFAAAATAARVLAWAVLPLAFAGAVLVGCTVHSDYVMNAVQHGSPFRFFSLGAGCLLAFHERPLLERSRARALVVAGCLAVALAMHPLLLYVLGPWWSGRLWLPLELQQATWLLHSTSLATAIVLLGIGTRATGRSPLRLLTWSPLRGVGRISYGLYLYHFPIYWALLLHAPTPALAAAAIVLTFVAAIVSYWMLERPLLRYAGRFRGAPPPSAIVGASA
ncbi:MAG TPA: acyltransferase [Planctomycetota bacterium]|nr:acyltransferase [Planctomycetota bacterium]